MIARKKKTLIRHKCASWKQYHQTKNISRIFSNRTWQERNKILWKQMKSTKNNDRRIGERNIRHRNYKLSLKIMRDKCVKHFYICAYFTILLCDIIRYYWK